MVLQGKGGTEFHRVKKMAYQRPDLFQKILEVTSASVIAYLNAQIQAGADAVMIFDTWGGSLTPRAFKTFSCDNLKKICHGLIREVDGEVIPRVVFTKGGGQWLERFDRGQALEGARFEAAFEPHFQTLQRQTLCRKAGSHRRTLFESAGPGGGFFLR